ncbi:hypothetical protein BD769DRAFT_1483394, partial [Suillus cothurnatus]
MLVPRSSATFLSLLQMSIAELAAPNSVPTPPCAFTLLQLTNMTSIEVARIGTWGGWLSASPVPTPLFGFFILVSATLSHIEL